MMFQRLWIRKETKYWQFVHHSFLFPVCFSPAWVCSIPFPFSEPAHTSLTGPSLVGAHGWGEAPGNINRLAEASLNRCSGQLMGHCCASARHHESLSFACVFKPCQFKNSKEFKAFKHKTWKSSNDYSRVVFGAHAESCISWSATPNRALFCVLLWRPQGTWKQEASRVAPVPGTHGGAGHSGGLINN